MIPQCTAERGLRNRGLCIVNRETPVVRSHRPNVKTSQHTCTDGGRQLVRTVHETPAGILTTVDEPAGYTEWRQGPGG